MTSVVPKKIMANERTPRKKGYEPVFLEMCSILGLEEKREAVQDFIRLFNYIIVCYARNYYNKNANWTDPYAKSFNTFDYQRAHENGSGDKLLEIQSEVFRFKNIFISKKSKTGLREEFSKFIDTSLYELSTNVIEPVKYTCSEIRMLTEKYMERPYIFRSTKMDYLVYEEIMKNQELL